MGRKRHRERRVPGAWHRGPGASSIGPAQKKPGARPGLFWHADGDPDPREVSAANDDAAAPHLDQIAPDQLRINAVTVTVRLTLHPPMASDS